MRPRRDVTSATSSSFRLSDPLAALSRRGTLSSFQFSRRSQLPRQYPLSAERNVRSITPSFVCSPRSRGWPCRSVAFEGGAGRETTAVVCPRSYGAPLREDQHCAPARRGGKEGRLSSSAASARSAAIPRVSVVGCVMCGFLLGVNKGRTSR